MKKLTIIGLLGVLVLLATAATYHAGMLELDNIWTGSNTFKKVNGVIYANQYASLAAAYADLPATGGVVYVPHGYTETLAANLNLNKPNSGFVFLGKADITMGAYQIIVPANTEGVFFKGNIAHGGHNTDFGVTFYYSGTSSAVLVGDAVTATYNFSLENISVNISGGAGATGIRLNGVAYFTLTNPSVYGNDTAGTFGMILDGTGPNFTGNGVIINPLISHVGTCIQGLGSLNNRMNSVQVLGGRLSSFVAVSGIGIDIESGNENSFYGTDLESNVTAIKFGAQGVANYADVRSEANTTDVQALAGSTNNIVRTRLDGGASPVVSDSGVANRFSRNLDGVFDYVRATNGVVPANGAAPTCDSTQRGKLWYVPGGAGVKDVVEVCAKDVADAYSWRAIY